MAACSRSILLDLYNLESRFANLLFWVNLAVSFGPCSLLRGACTRRWARVQPGKSQADWGAWARDEEPQFLPVGIKSCGFVFSHSELYVQVVSGAFWASVLQEFDNDR